MQCDCAELAMLHTSNLFNALRRLLSFLLLAVPAGTAWPQAPDISTLASGGVLSANEAKYDVQYYVLNLKIDPVHKTLSGNVEVTLVSIAPALDTLELDLINAFTVRKVESAGRALPFLHRAHKLKAMLFNKLAPQQRATFRIYYAGQPPVAVHPPWQGGFNWSQDRNGKPWIGVSCQGEGAKIWWPCKDHPSDEPDSVALNLTLPDSLYCAANGLLDSVSVPAPGWKTFHWKTHYPINNYNVSLNIGDYVLRKRRYRGTSGEMDIIFYVLKQDSAQAPALLEMANEFLHFYSRYFGEYPWIKEKFGLAETDYLGMEHQTINAYGNGFRKNSLGYDGLMLHEMGHEWWGNNVTVRDWADFWIHEGICSYAEALFVQDKFGLAAYHQYVEENLRLRIRNQQPIVPARNATTSETYNDDIYAKAAVVLHTLRYVLGEKLLLDILKTFATAPAYTLHHQVVTQDFIDLVNRKSGHDYTWFFQQYLFTANLPTLEHQIVVDHGEKKLLELRWRERDFRLPVEIRLTTGTTTTIKRLAVTATTHRFALPENAEVEIDPQRWILMNQATLP